MDERGSTVFTFTLDLIDPVFGCSKAILVHNTGRLASTGVLAKFKAIIYAGNYKTLTPVYRKS
jgi:hypothetical protein